MTSDKRLIEDYLPIQAISKEASREKSVRKGHISTLHLWWARRPLVACRAAVYGALVPASRFIPENGPDNKKQSLGRANAAKFVEALCKYPGNPHYIEQAQKHILEAHAERLTRETGKKVTVKDIEEGRAPRPKVLDMFAGGGAIPLEALRLGCEAYALDLNPVAHIIELCTLVYPQKYGKPDPNSRGMTGSKNIKGEATWGGLAEEVRYWGNWVLKKVKAEIGDLYPPLYDLEWWSQVGQAASLATQSLMFSSVKQDIAKTKRKLPHWEKEGACYFITYRTKGDIVLPENARDVVLENWKHWSGQRYDSWQVVVMPDHVHLLLSPLPKDDGSFWPLTEILHTAKSYTANQINKIMGRTGPLWQDERFDHIIRNPASFEEKWRYIRQNPCKKGLVIRPEDYKWLYENDGLAARPTLTPVAYLWTRTVRCKNPSCGATVPLVKQTWLCKKKGGKKSPGRYVALKMVAPKGEKKVRFDVVKAMTEKGLGFDPSVGSKGGNATCPFCGTVADSGYVKEEGCAKRMGQQIMAIVCTRPGRKGKVYISTDDFLEFIPDDEAIKKRIDELCKRTGLTSPTEPLVEKLTDQLPNYGMHTFEDIFTPRQMLCLLSFIEMFRKTNIKMKNNMFDVEHSRVIITCLASAFDKVLTRSTVLAPYDKSRESVVMIFGRQALPMVWDYAESIPVSRGTGSFREALGNVVDNIVALDICEEPAFVNRGTAVNLPYENNKFDAVITDPPYYDNIQYAPLSDFFYVWLKRSIGHLFSEHYSSQTTPKKKEIVASQWRHKSKQDSKLVYEQMMAEAFLQANRVLKPGAEMVIICAHKTTLGWATLIDSLRKSGFIVNEAWPLDTEYTGHLKSEIAALSSSIFLVARKREGNETGSYEDEVQSELDHIVRERVDTLWKMGITGADLVIAAVGAGLRAFTRFAKVEYANGEEVPAEKFLAEVEGVVLETLLEKIFGIAGSGVAAVDDPSRFYVLWRYTYKAAEMDAGEAIVFTYGQNVELDGQNGLSSGSRALVEKKKGKYRLYDFTERGDDNKLGLPSDDGTPAPLIDSLHRILWLIENEPRNLNRFLDEVRPDRERLRLVAQALAGTALAGKKDDGAEHLVATTASEQAALKKLVANWRALIDQRLAAGEGTLFDPGRK